MQRIVALGSRAHTVSGKNEQHTLHRPWNASLKQAGW